MIQFEIIDGVRRARVYYDQGIATIPAEIDGRPGIHEVPVRDLGSPHKSAIDASSTAAASRRFNSIVTAVTAGPTARAKLPPIRVRVGTRPPPIGQVPVL